MKDFREITISGSRDQLIATIAEIEKTLTDGWTRDKQIEERGRNDIGMKPDEMRFCFKCLPTKSRQGAMLALMSKRDGFLHLTNIVPDEVGQLTCDEFNDIVEEFLQKFARPAATKTGVTVQTTSGVVSIDDWFSKPTAEKLRRFLKRSDGSTAYAEDDKLWKSFLVAAHRENAKVREDLFRRWLEEDAGCFDYRAQNLASDYQRSQDILSFEAQYQEA